MTTTTAQTIVCPKCYGAKRFQSLAHIANGACFTCQGNGVIDVRAEKAHRTVGNWVAVAEGQYGVMRIEGDVGGLCHGGSFDVFTDAAEHRDALRNEHRSSDYVVVRVIDGEWMTRSGKSYGKAGAYN